MARRLAYTVHVPVSGQAEYEVFLRGTELPEWAAPLVGDHVYEPGEAPEKDAAPAPVPDEDPRPEQPAGNASADAWRLFAMSKGADPDDVLALSRNELRDKYGN